MKIEELINNLKTGMVLITFKKVTDDSIRTMRCSLEERFIGPLEQRKITKNSIRKERGKNKGLDYLIPVWDIGKGSWRTLWFYTIRNIKIEEEQLELPYEEVEPELVPEPAPEPAPEPEE